MKKYKILVDTFTGFKVGEIIYSHKNGSIYGKKKLIRGDKCIQASVIKNLPSYFQLVDEFELTNKDLVEYLTWLINHDAGIKKQYKEFLEYRSAVETNNILTTVF